MPPTSLGSFRVHVSRAAAAVLLSCVVGLAKQSEQKRTLHRTRDMKSQSRPIKDENNDDAVVTAPVAQEQQAGHQNQTAVVLLSLG